MATTNSSMKAVSISMGGSLREQAGRRNTVSRSSRAAGNLESRFAWAIGDRSITRYAYLNNAMNPKSMCNCW